MDDYLKQQTLERLNLAQNITICVNKNADFDAYASGLALFLSLTKTGKSISLFAKSPTVADAQSLYGVDHIEKESGKKNLIISIENAVKNVDKVTYFLDGDKLKVVIHAFPASNGVQENDVRFERVTAKPDLIIALAYSNQDELRTDITHEQQITPDDFIISISKNKTVQEFAQINIHEQSSYAELVTNFIENFGLNINEDTAFNLYAALASATKMFSPSLVGPRTFEIAQHLVGFGAGKASFATARPVAKPAPANIIQTFDVDNKKTELPAQSPQDLEQSQTPIEQVEVEKQKQDWLKPPKIYRGSKSFDIES